MEVPPGSKIESAVIKATEQNLLHHEKWNRHILRLLWVFVAILVLFEGLIAALYAMGFTLGATHTNLEYMVNYFLIPCGLVSATVGLSHLCIKTIWKKRNIEFISGVIVITMVLVVSELIALNHGTSIIFVMYVAPIILSTVYVNRKTLFFAYIMSLAFYLIVLFGYLHSFVSPDDYTHTYMDMLTNIGILTAVYLICLLIFKRIRELINTAVTQSIRQIELSHELSLDSLTQLYNHATFYEKLDEHIMRYKKAHHEFSLIVMDLDNFKSINDAWGHDCGDIVILRLVDLINAELREEELAFRYGGEEFTVLTPGITRGMELAERIRKAMEMQRFDFMDRSITISIGVSAYEASFGGRREFFSSADKALYSAKQSGKNRVCLSPELEKRLEERRTSSAIVAGS